MNANKVTLNGEVIIDLTSDTISPEHLLKGITAHDKSGAVIEGTYEVPAYYSGSIIDEDADVILNAGLYDASDNLIVSWDVLVNTYGMDCEKSYNAQTYNTDPQSPYCVLTALANGSKLVIDSAVKKIGNQTFKNCANLTSITIPYGVTRIGSYAFQYCTSLTSIAISNSVTYIDDGAFSGCSNLTSITITDNITSINNYTFQNCTNLTSVSIPGSVTSVGAYAFDGCDNLTNVYYDGTEEKWNSITILAYNSGLSNAEIYHVSKVKVEYNGSVIASIEAGKAASVNCGGKLMHTGVVVTVPKDMGGKVLPKYDGEVVIEGEPIVEDEISEWEGTYSATPQSNGKKLKEITGKWRFNESIDLSTLPDDYSAGIFVPHTVTQVPEGHPTDVEIYITITKHHIEMVTALGYTSYLYQNGVWADGYDRVIDINGWIVDCNNWFEQNATRLGGGYSFTPTITYKDSTIPIEIGKTITLHTTDHKLTKDVVIDTGKDSILGTWVLNEKLSFDALNPDKTYKMLCIALQSNGTIIQCATWCGGPYTMFGSYGSLTDLEEYNASIMIENEGNSYTELKVLSDEADEEMKSWLRANATKI